MRAITEVNENLSIGKIEWVFRVLLDYSGELLFWIVNNHNNMEMMI